MTINDLINFPVLVLRHGNVGDPYVVGWGGEDTRPSSITLGFGRTIYEPTVEISTYAEAFNGDLKVMVDRAFGSMWVAEHEPRNLAHRPVIDQSEFKTGNRVTTFRSLEPLTVEEGREERDKEQRAITSAEHRVTEIEIEDTGQTVFVTGDPELWTAGFTTTVRGSQVTAMLIGRKISFDLLDIQVTDDLTSYLKNAETFEA